MKNFILENKKVFIITLIVLIIFIMSAIIYNIINNSTHGTADNKNTEEYSYAPFKLSKLENINENNEPLLYDFVYGTNGYHSTFVDMIKDNCFIFCVNKNMSSNVYVSYLKGGEGDSQSLDYYLPKFSLNPYLFNLSSEENKNLFYNNISNFQSIQENEFIFYKIKTVEIYNITNNTNNFYSINLNDVYSNAEESQAQKDCTNGLGIDTKIIRKVCDLNRIYEIKKIDFNNEFWNNYNYNEKLLATKKDKNNNKLQEEFDIKGDKIYLTPMIIYHYDGKGTINSAEYKWAINNKISSDSVIYNLEYYGFPSIYDILNDKPYASEQAVNEIIMTNLSTKSKV